MIQLIKTGKYYTNAKFMDIKPEEKYERVYVTLALIALALAFMVAGNSDYATLIAQ